MPSLFVYNKIKPTTKSQFERDKYFNIYINKCSVTSYFRTLVSAVEEGREEDVMTYLSTADRTAQDWQENLDQSIVIAIKEKQPRVMKFTCGGRSKLRPEKRWDSSLI